MLQRKPSFSLVMLGAPGHAKTALTEALTRYCGGRGPKASSLGVREYTFETARRHYSLRDGLGQAGVLRGLLFGPSQPDAALLVIRATSGATGELLEQLALLRRLCVKALIIVLSHIDLIGDDELLDLVEAELRGLLGEHGFAGDELPFFRVDTSSTSPQNNNALHSLLERIEELSPRPQERIDDFLMLIEERYPRPGQDQIAAGHVLRGALKVGDSISLVNTEGLVNRRVSALEVAVSPSSKGASITAVGVIRERRARVTKGQWVSCHLSDASPAALLDSYALAHPASIRLYKEAQALLWLEPIVGAATLLFRIRDGLGGFRRLPEGLHKMAPRTIHPLSLPTIGMSHLEAPAYFDVITSRSELVVGCGVIFSLR